jgi:MoxR-like ATPase
MSDFLKFAFELVSQIVYNLVAWLVSIVGGFLKLFFTGVPDYYAIIKSYFNTLSFAGKILSVILILILIAIPVVLIILLVRHIILKASLRAKSDDNVVLYKEIGRLNKQVMDLMDEKNKILALKTGANTQKAVGAFAGAGGGDLELEPGSPAALSAGMADPLADGASGAVGVGVVGGVGGVAGAGGAVVAGGVAGGNVSVSGGNIGEDAISNAAAAAASAAAQARAKAEEEERAVANRFPKLHNVDVKYEDFAFPEYDDNIFLEDFVENYRLFASSQMHLYYTPEIIRRFVAGMAASHLLILEGISGTGKTSLPYSFSRYLDYPATLVSVQPSYRDRTELLGYFNEFSKKFNETEFLRALYEAGYRKEPSFIVLDEMNLARIEYYFAEMLSVLEMPSHDEWVLDLVPTAWPGDPVRMDGGKITVPENVWFIGTANNDDSTFTITDKVYDRAMPIELNERADAFQCDLQPRCPVSFEHLNALFIQAKEDHPISENTMAKMVKLDQYLQTRFQLAFGNRIVKQMYDFIPVYVACGGTEIDAFDYIIARKVLKKFESQNLTFIKDEIKGLVAYIDKTFGENHMKDSRNYLLRIQNLY